MKAFLKDVWINLISIFGKVPTTNQFIVDLIELCKSTNGVVIRYIPKQKLTGDSLYFEMPLDTFDWLIFLGEYQHLLHNVYPKPCNIDQANPKMHHVVFSVKITGYRLHELNIISLFCQSKFVKDTNIRSKGIPVYYTKGRMQCIGDGKYKLVEQIS